MIAHSETLSNSMPNTLGSQEVEQTPYTELSDISKAFGPKTVKTKHIEVTQFSPHEIAFLQDRANALAAYPNMCTIFGNACIAEPLEEAYLPNYSRSDDCGCS